VLARLDKWSLAGLPQLNVSILDGDLAPTALVDTLARHVLADLPAPEAFPPALARQLLVHLSMSGGSVARHYQERSVAHRATPEEAFSRLRVGVDRIPFRAYFSRLATQTGTGHYGRDTYTALITWNVPTTEVKLAGARLARLPGAFDDGQIRTYTNDPGERLFFLLIKESEALERAANELLAPVAAGTVPVHSAEGIDRVRLATTMLTALRQLNSDFAALPPEVGLRPGHFIDVFRQFAVHWQVGDIPPSGAHDSEALKRDLLLGLDLPDLAGHVRRQFPALLASQRAELSPLLGHPAQPDLLLASLSLDRATLAEMSADQLRRTVRQHPALAAWYLLLTAHARAAGVHLLLAKKFLFRLAHARATAGIPDTGVVSRTRGTTGMDESFLEQLTRLRHSHALACLHQIPQLELLALAGIEPPCVLSGPELATLVTVAGPTGLIGPTALPAAPVPSQRPAHPAGPATAAGRGAGPALPARAGVRAAARVSGRRARPALVLARLAVALSGSSVPRLGWARRAQPSPAR
jgi:hypothetical protein